MTLFADLDLAFFVLIPLYYIAALLLWCRSVHAAPNRVRVMVALPFVLIVITSLFVPILSPLSILPTGTIFCAALYIDRHELRTYPEIYKGILLPMAILFALDIANFLLMLAMKPHHHPIQAALL